MTLEAVYNIGYLKGSVIFNFGGLIYRKYDTFIDRSDSIKPSHPFKDYVKVKYFYPCKDIFIACLPKYETYLK